jgi:2-amino-4-hydroxy-6-hydroxymethyldihydropteridine diphosphokinase
MHVPHPRIPGRAFVLVPMNEIAPKLDIPGLGVVRDLLAAVDATGIEALD